MARRDSSLRTKASSKQDFELVDVDFGEDINAAIEHWLFETLDSYRQSHRPLHISKIPKWRKLYLGVPAEEVRSFPWMNASNVVVKLIHSEVDTLTAREVGLVMGTSPLWSYRYFGTDIDTERQRTKRSILENFMDVVANENSELDLYRIYSLWATDTNKLGTGFVKATYENRVESVAVGYTQRKRNFEDSTIYQGPKVHKLRHEDILADPGAATVADCQLIAHRRTLTRRELEERAALGIYERSAAEAILPSYDESSETEQKRMELQQQGISQQMGGISERWYVYECWFPWFQVVNGESHKFRLVYTVHPKTRTVLRKVFNFIPRNATPIVRARLSYSTDGMYGHGLCESLEAYQEALTSIINNRIDNSTVANCRFFRISPQLRNVDANFEIMPMGMVPAEKDGFEAIQMADVYPSSFENEESIVRHAQDLAGIAPAVSGLGAGTTGKTKGVYSSMGTMAMLQAGNSRTNHRTSDFRHASVALGQLLTDMYGKFPGTDRKAEMFGSDSDLLLEALRDFLASSLRIPIRSSDASVNREVDKQNDMLYAGLLQRHYTAVGQMLQALSNQMVPPDVKQFLEKVIKAETAFMRRSMRNFGYEEPEEYVPEPILPKVQGLGAPGGFPAPAPVPGVGNGASPQPGMAGAAGGPPGAPQPGGGGIPPLAQ